MISLRAFVLLGSSRRVALIGTLSMASAVSAHAQQSGFARVASAVASKPYGCVETTGMPTVLASTPEGRSLVKLRRELDVVTRAAALQKDSIAVDTRTIANTRRGVDSLVKIIVRSASVPDTTFPTLVVTDLMVQNVAHPSRSQVEAHIRELRPRVAELSSRMLAGFPIPENTPSGWVGLRVSGSFFRETTADGLVTRYCDDYPVIEAVDPGSPAEKSGLQAGDTLIAFNSRDVLLYPIVHSHTFVPGHSLRVRYKRVGRFHDVPVTVAPPQADIVVEVVALPRPARLVSGVPFTPIKGDPPVSAVGMLVRETGAAVIAGAHVTQVGKDLSRSLDLEQGLLVLRVLSGTPLGDAGLRAGEVIRSINGKSVSGVSELHRAFSSSTREAVLEVAPRGQPMRTVNVKW